MGLCSALTFGVINEGAGTISEQQPGSSAGPESWQTITRPGDGFFWADLHFPRAMWQERQCLKA